MPDIEGRDSPGPLRVTWRKMSELLPDLILRAADAAPDQPALVAGDQTLSYGALDRLVRAAAGALLELGLGPAERVGVFLDKRVETVAACFGAAAAGGAFVPVNPLLRPRQVGYILRDCNVRVLVTSASRLRTLAAELADCPDLRAVIVIDGAGDDAAGGVPVHGWAEMIAAGTASGRRPHRRIDGDMVAIFYTSGSTGMPKGVVLCHRNMVTGAKSVCSYLENTAEDRLLAALPLSFDAGFSQLTTAFNVGARVVLLNYLLPRDVVNAVVQHGITGLTGVPPLYVQLTQAPWPEPAAASLRYLANTGGVMPRPTLERLRAALPRTRVFLMYGLTEAFRSTYLSPEEIDRRPGSMGKAIPNVEILVVDAEGRPCRPGDEGELVHRGPLVSLGYWNDPARTAERFRPVPGQPRELCLPEIAVWSGDTVRMDEDGFLYFVGRRDEMIKCSGNRVSPAEIEEVLYASGLVGEAVAVGAPHPALGQGIVVIAAPPAGERLNVEALLAECRRQLAPFQVPQAVVEKPALPRNANGKIDRSGLRQEVAGLFEGAAP